MTVERTTALRAEPTAVSPTLAELAQGTVGEVTGKRGAWLQIKTPAATGWVFSFHVRFAGEQFNSSFEDGAFAAWLADDGGQVEGGGSISTERAHSGSYSWKAYNDPALSPPDNFSAKLTRWRFDDDPA